MWTLLASTCMAGSWIPAFAAERHSHCTNMLVGSTPQKHPSHWTNMLGGNDGRVLQRPTGLFDQHDGDVVDVGAGRRDTNEVAQLVEEVVGVVVLKEG